MDSCCLLPLLNKILWRYTDISKEDYTTTSCPLWAKLNLTIKEAAEYSNIGENRLRELVDSPNCTFVLSVGNKKKLIKRRPFEQYIESKDWI
ncbi:excisionase [Sporofaciens musculi]|uniref:excisionase n=1 Tax=Sporofaciens musculi TaxID=2681861 RepID=UPI002AC33806|nr:excisionase [Sporofaciens musculi]